MTTIPAEVTATAARADQAQPEAGPAAADVVERWSFRPDVRVNGHDDDVRIAHRWGELPLGQLSAPVAAALRRLGDSPVSPDELARGVLRGGGSRRPGEPDTDLAALHWLLDRLEGLVIRAIWSGGRQLIAAVPMTPRARLASAAVGPDDPVRLSRFAYLRRRGDGLVAESPLSLYRLESTSPEATALLAALGRAATVADLAAALPAGRTAAGYDVTHAMTSLLISAGLAHIGANQQHPSQQHPSQQRADADKEPLFAEESDPTLRQWSFHDLLFHSRSRLGRHDEDFGAMFPFIGELEPQPAVRPLPDGPRTPLPRPELAGLLKRDATLTAVMEARRSIRDYDERPPTLADLGELLYRAARVRATLGPEAERGMPYPATDRPYPSGGASYDLELYLTVRRCEGLEAGGYFYDPLGHQLIRLSQPAGASQQLLTGAAIACGGATVPDILVTLTARFGRLGWKYRGMAYATTLKHVGVVYQTLYLVATAMGLAPCGLGSGDADLAARAFGLDWTRESSVGEFMLGRRPAGYPDNPIAAAMPSYRPANDPQWAAEAAHAISQSRSTPQQGAS
jgi:SagB-type dehydrogenase family enzyme